MKAAAHTTRQATQASADARMSQAKGGRFEGLDALRGTAMVWMALFHFAFDLNYFGLIARQDFYRDPFWTWQRTAIVSLFLLAAGAGQAIAQAQGQPAARFWRRWAQVAACALLVSAGSWFMFPNSWISFGVLHGIALMLIVLRLLSPLPTAALLAIAVAALLLPQHVQHPLFDSRWTNWVGLVTRKPVTEDFVPLLPWLSVMLVGFACTRMLLSRQPVPLIGGALPRGLKPLAALGQWPLTFYMLHQPLLIGALLLWRALVS